jgi:hypothetical protein
VSQSQCAHAGDEEVDQSSSANDNHAQDHIQEGDGSLEEVMDQHEETRKRVPPDKATITHQHHHNTRSKGKVLALKERPNKPEIPHKREAMRRPEWQKAMARELDKINAEDTIQELPKGQINAADDDQHRGNYWRISHYKRCN